MPTAQRIMRALARQQFGLVSALDARQQNITQKAIQSLLSRGVLDKDIRGVYRFTDEPQPPEQRVAAALLWTQRTTAALSHVTALAAHGLVDTAVTDLDTVDVTVAKGERIRIQPLPGMALHYANVDRADITRWRGLPVVDTYTAITQVMRDGYDADALRDIITTAAGQNLLDEDEALDLRTRLEAR